MIASVRGRVLAVRLDAAVVEVGGVGLLVQATPATLAGLRIGAEAELATSLVVREDSLTLFGFADADERDVFETVQTVSGIGPAAGAGDARRAHSRRPAAGGGRAGPDRPDEGPGDRAQGRPADRAGARPTGSVRRRPAAERSRPVPRSAASSAGAALRDQVVEALVGLGLVGASRRRTP